MMQAVKYILAILLLAGLWSCKKEKADYLYQEQPQLPPLTPSTARLMNMGVGATELFINDTPLTSLTPPNIEGYYLAENTRQTIYFANGRLGATYTIPQRFIKPDGTAHIQLGGMAASQGLFLGKQFDIKEDANHPTDFYNVLYGPHIQDQLFIDSVFAIPRSISPPVNPQNIKIRLLNLSSGPDRVGLEGNLSLAFADGTLVNPATTNVAPGGSSEYIEVPYGTYQFKVLNSDGRVLPGVPVNPDEQLKDVNPLTGTMTISSNPTLDKWFTYACSRTFQPGGVYTVLVSATGAFQYYTPGSTFASPMTINSFRIIPDITEPLNITYGRVQAVNALPGSKVLVSVDNQLLQEGALNYTVGTAYQTYIRGTHTVTIKDAAGNQLAEQSLDIAGSDNYTAWVYPDANGKPSLKVVTNNLSGAFYLDQNPNSNGDDGSNNQFSVTMPVNIRFLNLTTDVPEVSFTGANGQVFSGYLAPASAASQHLKQGQVVTQQAYAQFSISAGVDLINTYASQPNVLPGDWIREIPSLKGTDFIARPALYTGNKPAYEAGIYTVALVGSLHPKSASDQPAKMIIIKHNQ